MSGPGGTVAPFPWEMATRIGFGVLKLSPAAFWSMTPRELDWAARAVLGDPASAPGRDELSTLMMRFPDRTG